MKFKFKLYIETNSYNNLDIPNFEVFNIIFVNRDEIAITLQVLGRFMTKSINYHGIMGLVSIVAYP